MPWAYLETLCRLLEGSAASKDTQMAMANGCLHDIRARPWLAEPDSFHLSPLCTSHALRISEPKHLL